ncbi:hypothetical protein OK016_30170 [Vibrio chagasii]|nr:hypothetical protein [Vibrio chagasii]
MAFWAFDKPNSEQINTLNLFIEELNDLQEVYLFLCRYLKIIASNLGI